MPRLKLGNLLLAAALFGAFSFSSQLASAAKYKVLYSFVGKRKTNIGEPGGLMIDQSGNLFGVTAIGPHHGLGTVYELLPGKNYTFQLLHGFCHDCNEGAYPNSPLIMDVQGNLYGTTAGGGGTANRNGTAFRVSPDGTFTLLYTFCSQDACKDGTGPSSGLTYAGASTGARYDGASPLFGVAQGGGSNSSGAGGGVAYQLTPGEQGWTESVLYNFCSEGGAQCTDGASPGQDLLVEPGGNLVGVTGDGGNHPDGTQGAGAGVVYELMESGGDWSEKLLYSFCSQKQCSDGDIPSSPLLPDAQGNLYGTTSGGGPNATVLP